MPTLKEEHDSALAKVSELESKLKTAEQSVVDLTTKASEAEQKFKTEQEAHSKTKADLDQAKADLASEKAGHKAADDELNTLKGQHQSADKRAAENLAAAHVDVSSKQTPAALNQNQAADAATWERYQKASATEQAKMRRELGSKLDAAAEAFDREHAAK